MFYNHNNLVLGCFSGRQPKVMGHIPWSVYQIATLKAISAEYKITLQFKWRKFGVEPRTELLIGSFKPEVKCQIGKIRYTKRGYLRTKSFPVPSYKVKHSFILIDWFQFMAKSNDIILKRKHNTVALNKNKNTQQQQQQQQQQHKNKNRREA